MIFYSTNAKGYTADPEGCEASGVIAGRVKPMWPRDLNAVALADDWLAEARYNSPLVPGGWIRATALEAKP